ncbi:MAG: tetratricopeptide repeat protein [Candidatus Thorarchaeota archaeon]
MDNAESSVALQLYTRGERYLRFHELAAAEESLREALRHDNRHAQSWYLLGMVYSEMGRIAEARKCFGEALTHAPGWLRPMEQLGRLEYAQHCYVECVNILKDYFRQGGADPDVMKILARAAHSIGNYEVALSVTSIILESNEDDYEMWELRGLCQAAMGKFNAASVSLNIAIDINPDSISALNHVGDICYESDNYLRAVEFYEMSLAKKPEQKEILFRCATALWFVGRWNEAIPILERYVQLVQDDPKGWNNLGIALREKGHIKRAIESLNKALSLDPDNPVIRNNISTATNKQALK